MQTKRLLPLLLAAAMLQPLPVRAEEVTVSPPYLGTAEFPDIGWVNIHLGRDFYGTDIEIFQSTLEGELLFYSYENHGEVDTVLRCRLREGNYRLVAAVPSAREVGTEVHEYAFSIQDPDMDIEQRFDLTELHIYLAMDATLESDTAESGLPEIIDRVVTYPIHYTIAHPHLVLGDLDGDGDANAADSSMILVASTLVGTGHSSGLTGAQTIAADVDRSGDATATDASYILSYSTEKATGHFTGDLWSYVSPATTDQGR